MPNQYIEVINPFNQELVGKVRKSSLDELNSSIELCYEAFKTYALQMTPYQRWKILLKSAELIESHKEELAKLITSESGKVIRESRIEVDRSISTLTFAAEEAKRIQGEIYPCDIASNQTGKMAHVYRKPIGVVGAITPFNFPINTVMHKVAPALAAGNSIVLKPSPKTPLSAERMREFFIEAGLPSDLFMIVHGDAEIGEAIAKHDKIRLLTFTGSVKIGEHLSTLVGLKKVTMELGGNDPLIIYPDANIDQAVDVAIEQGLGTAGQRCTAVKRLFIHEEIYEKVKQQVLDKVSKLNIGDPLLDKTDIGPLIDENAAMNIENKVDQAIRRGAKSLLDRQRTKAILNPVLLEGLIQDDEVISEETFGPVLPMIRFSDDEDCIRFINSTPYGLQAGLFTENLNIIKKFFNHLEVGTLIINGGPGFRVDSIPFGGVKKSGLGREGVISAMIEMTEEKGLIL